MDYRAKANSEALTDKMLVANLDAKQLGAAMGISKKRIEQLANGEEAMSALELYRFCEFFGCKLEDFFIGCYDFPKARSEFPKDVTPAYKEKYLIKYFRQITVPDLQDYLCGLVRAIAKDEV
jgi:transcriptional regulator with XRE-family HTH domain